MHIYLSISKSNLKALQASLNTLCGIKRFALRFVKPYYFYPIKSDQHPVTR